MKTYPEVGSRVELVNFLSGEAAQGRVLALRCAKEGEVLGVAVELVVPSENFWGVNFQLKKTNAELLKLEQALKSGGVDLRILGEFRNAVDYVRVAAGAVQELQECQLQGRSTEKVLSLLTLERIRRTTYLCNELATDLLPPGTASHDTKAIAELLQAVERIYQRLKPVRKEREPQRVLGIRR